MNVLRSEDHSYSWRPQVGVIGLDLKKSEAPRLKDVYESYFDIVMVETRAQLEAAHRLRYRVYCLENRFEDLTLNPGGIEYDGYDSHALHALLLHRNSGIPIGTVRLILPWPRDPIDLPIRKVISKEQMHNVETVLPWTRTAEISRFSITKEFCRALDRATLAKLFPSKSYPRRSCFDISFGLIRAIIMMARRASITHVCAVMEPKLLRMLRKSGIHFQAMGPTVQYHGVRQPCYADLSALLTRAWNERRDVWELITDDGRFWSVTPSPAE